MKAEWKRQWPALGPHNGRLTSAETPDYNCLAFAAGKTDEWWEPYVVPPEQPGIYWPPGVHPDNRPEDWAAALATVGFEPCDDGAPEAGFEKVVIYVNASGAAAHAARQLTDGRWTSKLGALEDIEHDALEALEGSFYGAPRLWLRRALGPRVG